MNEPARSIISKVSPTRHLVPARRIVSTHFRSRPTPNCTVLHGCVQVNQHAKRRKLMPQVPAQGLPREPCLSQEKRRKRRPLQPSLHFERRPSCQTQAEVRRIPTTTDALCMTCPHRRAQEGGEGGAAHYSNPIQSKPTATELISDRLFCKSADPLTSQTIQQRPPIFLAVVAGQASGSAWRVYRRGVRDDTTQGTAIRRSGPMSCRRHHGSTGRYLLAGVPSRSRCTGNGAALCTLQL